MAKRAHEEHESSLSKEHRRKRKLAKLAVSASLNASPKVNGEENEDPTSDLSKAERKALKRAKKAARAARKAGVEDESRVDSGITTATASTPEPIAEQPTTSSTTITRYTEHASLAALPPSTIDSFITTNSLSVSDPLSQPLRPITSFTYLPTNTPTAALSSFSQPTPIQASTWPYLLSQRDLIGIAETGSGKTFAFALPCIQHLRSTIKPKRSSPRACILTPTRELASQIHSQLLQLSEPAGLKAALVYGGVDKSLQRPALSNADIVTATPGRLQDFINEGAVDLSGVQYLVLDEADRMLDTGFEDAIRRIIATTPQTGRQTVMFTATWPASVQALAERYMASPVKITVGDNNSGELQANKKIVQEVLVMEEYEKREQLLKLLRQYGRSKERILIFCLYKKEARRTEEFIRGKGFTVAGIHGDLSQEKRSQSLEAFKSGKVPLLVATDVAARGLDIPMVRCVINVTFPLTVEDYVHRIGRTGRAGKDGKAVTFFTTNEKALAGALSNVLRAAGQEVPEALARFGGTVKKKGHGVYGAFYREDAQSMKKAVKITFD